MVLSYWVGFFDFYCFVDDDDSNLVLLFFARPRDGYVVICRTSFGCFIVRL